MSSELLAEIECRIAARTSGRRCRLSVDGIGNAIRITGQVDSYYTKQLALHAVLEWLGPGTGFEVTHDIAVR